VPFLKGTGPTKKGGERRGGESEVRVYFNGSFQVSPEKRKTFNLGEEA
jgi:hypothetical protein